MSRKPAAAETAFAGAPSSASLAALVLLGTLASLWSLFLWGELRVARAGGPAFCALGGAADCSVVWDAPLATSVHRATGLPLAGWGLAWGLAAFLLALAALLRRTEDRPLGALVTALRLLAAGGLLVATLLLGVMAASASFCAGCLVLDLVVAGFAGIALFGWPGLGWPDPPRGAALATGATAVLWLALLVPGQRTPAPAGRAGREAVEKAAAAPAATSAGTGNAEKDQMLTGLVGALEPSLKQALADSLALYRRGPATELPPPRVLTGSASAPVRITEFTDVLCSHCADLHATLRMLRERLPAGSFSTDTREFPLDGRCNTLVAPATGDLVRCTAARARVCLQDHPKRDEFAGKLFEAQEGLTADKVLSIADGYVPRATLQSCLADPKTEARLEDDVRLAGRYQPDGTPIVLVNGRLGTSFGPFLYAMVLTGGSPDHPSFASLPPPNPSAHIH